MALYTNTNQVIKEQCSLVVSHMPPTFIPIAVTLNLWIIPSNPQTSGSTIMIICSDKATSKVPHQQPFHMLRLSPTCSPMYTYFHLPSHYEDHIIIMNVSLDTANINTINISTLDFRTWQHFSSKWTPLHLQKLENVPEVPVRQCYRDLIKTSVPIHSFTIKDDKKDPSLMWTILMHSGTYIGTISMIYDACIAVCCFKRFRPTIPGADLILQSLHDMPQWMMM